MLQSHGLNPAKGDKHEQSLSRTRIDYSEERPSLQVNNLATAHNLWKIKKVDKIVPVDGAAVAAIFKGGMGVDAPAYAEMCRSAPRLKLDGVQKTFNRQRDSSYQKGSFQIHYSA